MNYYLGKRAHDERGEGRFPTIDFCLSPEAMCASESSTEDMRWIVGLFEWIERIQSYLEWDYSYNLKAFVEGGMLDDSFIDTVSSIFTRGCHEPNCSSNMKVTMKEKRQENFKKVLEIFGLPELTVAPTFSRPRPLATPNPPTQKPNTPAPVKNILPPSLTWSQPPPQAQPVIQPQPQPSYPTVQNPNPAYMGSPNYQNQGGNPTNIGAIPSPNENPAFGPTQQSIPTQPITPTDYAGQYPSQPVTPSEPYAPSPSFSTERPTRRKPGNNGLDIEPENDLINLDSSASLPSSSWWIISLAIQLCLFSNL